VVTDDLPPRVAALARADPKLADELGALLAARAAADEAFAHAPIGMALQRPDGHFVRVNRALCDLLGYSEPELLRRTRHEITHPDDQHAHGAEDALRRAEACATVDERYLTATGTVVWVAVADALVRDAAGAPSTIVSVVQDVSERKRVEDDLRHAADHDDLTGLPNRRRFERDLARQIEVCRRYGEPAALVLLDLDHLKRVNDTRGHRAGDELLEFVGGLLTARLRASDLLARLGGDEFAVLLPHTTAGEALAVAEALVDAVRGGAPFGCTASAGVALLDRDAIGAADVLAASDRALYAAKHGGRDGAVLAER
jgi:diguanylate cyclase (GGDEF)-like protein/PAS domain S-box-containing protein